MHQNIIAVNYIKQVLANVKIQVNINAVLMGALNIPCTNTLDKKYCKEIPELNPTFEHMGLLV